MDSPDQAKILKLCCAFVWVFRPVFGWFSGFSDIFRKSGLENINEYAFYKKINLMTRIA